MAAEWRDTIYGPICADFAEDRLRNLCEPDTGIQTGPFGSQLHQEDYVHSGTPIITVEHLGENRIAHANLPRVSDADRDRLSRYALRKGDIVFSRVGSVDRRALVRDAEDGWLFSGRCLRVRPDPAKVDSKFLSYFFGLSAFRAHVRAIAVGATMPSLNTALLSEVTVAYPRDIGVQQAIANILGSLDDKIELNRQVNEALQAIAQLLFKSWFVDFDPVRAKVAGRDPSLPKQIADLFPNSFESSELGEIPSGWTVGSILEHARLMSGGTPKTDRPEYWDGQISWASAKDVSQSPGLFLIDTERTITQKGLDESATQMVPRFCSVVVARGATTGRMVLFGREMAMNQTCYALATSTQTPFALYCRLKAEIDGLVHAAHGSVFDTITTRTFASSRIVLPEPSILMAFEKRVAAMFGRILENTNESHTLASVRDTLLPKLICGQVRIADAEKFAGAAA